MDVLNNKTQQDLHGPAWHHCFNVLPDLLPGSCVAFPPPRRGPALLVTWFHQSLNLEKFVHQKQIWNWDPKKVRGFGGIIP